MTQLVLVRVGSDERPATDRDIQEVSDEFESMRGMEPSVKAFPHTISFETFDVHSDDSVIVKVGNDNKPASDEDLKATQDDIEKALELTGERVFLITHHAIELQIVKKSFWAHTAQ